MKTMYVLCAVLFAAKASSAAELSIYERGPSISVSNPHAGSMSYDGREYRVKGAPRDARGVALGLGAKLDTEAAYATRSLIDAYLASPTYTVVRPIVVSPPPVVAPPLLVPAPSVFVEEEPFVHHHDAGIIPSPFPWDPYGFYEHSRTMTHRSRTMQGYAPHTVPVYPHLPPAGVHVW